MSHEALYDLSCRSISGMGDHIATIRVVGVAHHHLQRRFIGLLHHFGKGIGDLELALYRLKNPSIRRDHGTTLGYGFQFIVCSFVTTATTSLVIIFCSQSSIIYKVPYYLFYFMVYTTCLKKFLSMGYVQNVYRNFSVNLITYKEYNKNYLR
jgi:hypothetical protein